MMAYFKGAQCNIGQKHTGGAEWAQHPVCSGPTIAPNLIKEYSIGSRDLDVQESKKEHESKETQVQAQKHTTVQEQIKSSKE